MIFLELVSPMQVYQWSGAEAPHKKPALRGTFPEHSLNFRWILEKIEILDDDTTYIFLEFNMRGELYSSKELKGKDIKSRIYKLAWHMSHSYRILEKKQFRSPVSVSVGHRIPERVDKVLH